MIDGYKKQNGYLCWFLSVFLKKMTISSNRYLLIQLPFILNILVY